MNLNKVMIIGRVTKEIELKQTPNGVKVANFSIATNHTYKDKDGNKQENAEFHNIVLFGKLAELVAEYVEKGQELMIEGRLSTSSWEKEGKKYYKTDIIGESMQFGQRKQDKSN